MAHIEIQGYKFITELEGREAQQALNDYYNIPKTPTSITTQYTLLNYPTINNEYYIIWSEGITEVLGEAETITLPDDPPNL